MGAFQMGWIAATEGKLFAACPFHSQTGEAIAWRNGWRAFWNDYGPESMGS